MQLIYKMDRHQTPNFLTNLLPTFVGVNRQGLRNNFNYRIPNFRLSITNMSFLPSSLRIWNSLDYDIRSMPFASFKSALFSNLPLPVPRYYLHGDRKFNILHSRLRHKCSSLKHDLYHANLSPDSICLSCGYYCENAYHYFFECQTYLAARTDLIESLNNLDLHVPLSLDLLLFGNEQMSLEVNCDVFSKVHIFIRSSGRF